jgi:DNA-dependent RNA polymerase auxiliary subunit epsilon
MFKLENNPLNPNFGDPLIRTLYILVVQGEIEMVFKVYFQENRFEVPVRERTRTIYVEAKTEREVREKLSDRNYNIELVQKVTGAFLEYEQQSENYKMETV